MVMAFVKICMGKVCYRVSQYFSLITSIDLLYNKSQNSLFIRCSKVFVSLTDGDETLILLSVIATFAGKMSVTGSFSTLFLFTPELYPTNLRYSR